MLSSGYQSQSGKGFKEVRNKPMQGVCQPQTPQSAICNICPLSIKITMIDSLDPAPNMSFLGTANFVASVTPRSLLLLISNYHWNERREDKVLVYKTERQYHSPPVLSVFQGSYF